MINNLKLHKNATTTKKSDFIPIKETQYENCGYFDEYLIGDFDRADYVHTIMFPTPKLLHETDVCRFISQDNYDKLED